jgi:hypothetical protein
MKFQWGKNCFCSLTTLNINQSRAGEGIIENISNHDAFNVEVLIGKYSITSMMNYNYYILISMQNKMAACLILLNICAAMLVIAALQRHLILNADCFPTLTYNA